jgi:hypothetical protein
LYGIAVVYQAAGRGERPSEPTQNAHIPREHRALSGGRNVAARWQPCRPKHCPAPSECAKKPEIDPAIDLGVDPATNPAIELEEINQNQKPWIRQRGIRRNNAKVSHFK